MSQIENVSLALARANNPWAVRYWAQVLASLRREERRAVWFEAIQAIKA